MLFPHIGQNVFGASAWGQSCLQLTRLLTVVSTSITDIPWLNVALGLAMLQYLVTYLQAQETLATTEAKKEDD